MCFQSRRISEDWQRGASFFGRMRKRCLNLWVAFCDGYVYNGTREPTEEVLTIGAQIQRKEDTL